VRKVLVILIMFSLVFSLSAVESAGVEAAISFVEFSSLEDFLKAYLTAKEGKEINEFIDFEVLVSSEDKNIVECIRFIELETIYLLTEIPENFFVHFVQVNENYVWIIYLPKDFRASEGAKYARNMYLGNPYYSLTFTREENEKIYIESHNMEQNISFREARASEIKAVDLTNTNEIMVLLYGELTTADALLILRAVAGLVEFTDEQIARFGIDGVPTTTDALRILQTVAGLT